MSWDVRIGKWDITKEHNVEEEDNWPVIGISEEIYHEIKSSIPGIDDEFSSYMRISNDDYVGNISLGGEGDISRSITFFVYSGNNPLKLIVDFSKKHGFVAYDTTSAKYIDLDNPSDEGWVEHQNFVKSLGLEESGVRGF